MVGVPRSKGCLACLKRRVKCDETEPECQCCQRRGLPCPGYIRDRKFSNRFSTSSKFEPANTTTSQAPSITSNGEVGLQEERYVVVARATMPMDGAIAPYLVAKTLDQQSPDRFGDFLDAVFPHIYHSYSARLEVPWVDFARHKPDDAIILDWSFRSLGSLHSGKVHGSEREVLGSREMYGHGLRHLVQSVKCPASASTDVTLAAAILLSVYEFLNSDGEESWLLHVHGIAQLFCLRGPQNHTSGFGRCLLLSFRGLLVYEAFAAGEECFLGREEWRALVPLIIEDEERRGKSARITQLIDYAFNEIAQCPGFLVMVKSLISSPSTTNAERENLIVVVNTSHATLKDLQRQILSGLKTYQEEGELDSENFFGLVPKDTRDALTKYSIEGIRSAIALLQQLLAVLVSDRGRQTVVTPWLILDPSKTKWEVMKNSVAISKMSREQNRLHLTAGPHRQANTKLWPDRIFLTMGMPGKY